MKINILLFLLSIFCFSCADDEIPDREINLLGSWKAVQASFLQCDDPANNISEINYGECPDQVCLQLIFTEEEEIQWNFQTLSAPYQEIAGTYILEGTRVTVCLDGIPNCFDFRVEMNGDQLDLSQSPQSNGCIPKTTFERI